MRSLRLGELALTKLGNGQSMSLQPEQDVVAEVMRITNGNGARVAFDSVGGPDLPKLISALTNRRIVYIYGALSRGAEIEASQASASDT